MKLPWAVADPRVTTIRIDSGLAWKTHHKFRSDRNEAKRSLSPKLYYSHAVSETQKKFLLLGDGDFSIVDVLAQILGGLAVYSATHGERSPQHFLDGPLERLGH